MSRLKELADWLHVQHDRDPLELLRAGRGSADCGGGDGDRYDRANAARESMGFAIEMLQDFGVVVELEDRGRRRVCRRRRLANRRAKARAARALFACCSAAALGRKVEHRLRQAAPVEGFVGFAIGRSIWWDALKGYLDGNLERAKAAEQVADKYLHFVQVYDEAASGARV